MKRYASYDYDSSNEESPPSTSTASASTTKSSSSAAATSSTTTASSSASNKRMRTCPSNSTPTTINKIGNYLIGPKLNGFNYGSINQYLCRKVDSKEFFILKILNNEKEKSSLNSRRLLHNEFTLLTLLKEDDGIMHHHGLFKEINCINGENERSEKLCLVLDCYLRHEYDNKHYFTNLQHYIIKQKYLNEREALALLYKIMKIVENIHKKNIVHRDLKLGNIVYDLKSQRVYLINFCLGHHLIDENEPLNEQFGSPAYISPEVLSSMPYYGKPNDIWQLGVILFTMLFGHLPFYDPIPDRLFNKIQAAEYTIPSHIKISDSTKLLIKNMLTIDPLMRLNASQVLDSIMSIFASQLCKTLSIDNNKQQQQQYKMFDSTTTTINNNTNNNNNKKNNKFFLRDIKNECQYDVTLTNFKNLSTSE